MKAGSRTSVGGATKLEIRPVWICFWVVLSKLDLEGKLIWIHEQTMKISWGLWRRYARSSKGDVIIWVLGFASIVIVRVDPDWAKSWELGSPDYSWWVSHSIEDIIEDRRWRVGFSLTWTSGWRQERKSISYKNVLRSTRLQITTRYFSSDIFSNWCPGTWSFCSLCRWCVNEYVLPT